MSITGYIGISQDKSVNNIIPLRVIYFLGLILLTILVKNSILSSFDLIWYIFLFFLYFKSKDEPGWLALFFIISDGFLGFLGPTNVALIELFPGLPGVEITQVYILLSFIKAIKKKERQHIFFRRILLLLFFYILLLYIIGLGHGLSLQLNLHLRVLRLIIPLLLFYAIPVNMPRIEDFNNFFAYMFLVGISTGILSVLNVIMGVNPIELLNMGNSNQLSESQIVLYRGFYNVGITLISLFGTLYYLATKREMFGKTFLYFTLLSLMLNVFLSATRGWIIGFSLILILYLILVVKLKPIKMLLLIIVVIFFYRILIMIPSVEQQISFSWDRLLTLNSLAEGDVTAEGTLKRLDVRGPKVIKKWEESPIFGWGFSDEYFANRDGHVGNQSILLHGGIVGFFLLIFFFIFFHVKLMNLSSGMKFDKLWKNRIMIFPVFFLGWIVIHSTSGQHFGLYGVPFTTIPQAVYFSFGAVIYNRLYYLKYNLRN